MSSVQTTNKVEQFLFRRGGKYPVIGCGISLIHAFYLYYFYRINLSIMATYNFFAILLYLFFAAEAYKGNKIKGFFIYTIIEIPLHAILSSIYVGFECRFALVLFTGISILFYLLLFFENFKHPVIFGTIVGFLYCVIYIGLRIYCTIYPPLYTNYKLSHAAVNFYVYYNFFISFVGIIFFNILNAIEYGYIKSRLMTENSKLDTYATFDPLTNLLNRRSTDEKLKQLFDAHYHDEDAFSIIMCDIDKFKNVNDTYGHDAGDYVLKEVAWILKDTVRDGDVVSRWGGEEFLIIVNNNKANAAILAERIRSQVELHTYNYKNTELHVTITLGVSSYHANTDVNSLIKSADQKLYRGKETDETR